METKKRLFGWLCLLCISITLAAITACSSANEEISSPIETVKNPTKVVNYEDSKYFKDDLETMMDYAHALQAMRWAAMCVMSNDFKYDDLSRPATIEDVERNTTSMPRLFQIEQYVVEHAAEYEAALERLEQGGALDDPAKTRGPLGDGLAFILGCRKSQVLGRKSVLAVMRKTGSTTNTAELQRLYNLVPAEQRRGYSDAVTFWTDFSAGKLDSRANVIFQNLYTHDYMNFGSTAKDMGISPAGNMAKTTADLVEKGGSLIISAAPGNLSSSLGYSKDIWQTYQVAGEVGSNLFSGKLSTEDGKKVLQQVFNLACNYADQLKNYAETRKFEGTMDLIDDWDFFAAVDVLNTTVNGSVFGDELLQLFPPELAEKIVPQVTFITDKNGNQIPLVILRDNTTGDVCVSYTLDKDGNIMMVPKDFGTKTLTVVDRDGHRHTKTVLVDENTNIEIDMEEMEKEETVLEDEPSHGYLLLQPGIITEKFGLSSTDEIRVRTNYLYYTCHTEDKWISASPKTDISQVVVRLAANDTGEKREGKVFVIATNKAGKPLKTEVIEVTQMPKEAAGDLIWTTPTSVSFAPDGGKQSIVVNHAVGYSFIGCMEGSDLAGWCYLEATESDAGSPTYTINCEPNNTNEGRSGTVTFYTANSKSALEAVLYSGAKPDGTTVAATTVLIKQEAGGESDFAKILIGKWYNAPTSFSNGATVSGFEFTKDGKYKWFSYWIERTPGTNKLAIVKPEDAMIIKGTYTVSGNKIRFNRSSGSGYAWDQGAYWGYNYADTYILELEDGKDVHIGPGDDIPYQGKCLRFKYENGKVPSSYNYPYYYNLWDIGDLQLSTDIERVSIAYYCKTGGDWSGRVNESFYDVTASKSGNSFHITATKKESNDESQFSKDYSITFDIEIIDDCFKDITNLKYISNAYWGKQEASRTEHLEVNRLPKEKATSPYVNSGVWSREEKDGKVITKYEVSGRNSKDSGGGTFSHSYKYDDENYIIITVAGRR